MEPKVCTAGAPSPFSLERLSAYLEGDLPAGELASVRQHLEACAACAGHADELAALTRAARTLEVPEPPATLWPGIAGALARDDDGALARERWSYRWLAARPFGIGMLAGVGAAAVIAIVRGVSRGRPMVAREVPPAAVEPIRAVLAPPGPRDPLLAEAEQEFARAAAVYERSIEKLRRLLVREEASWSPEMRARYDERLARLDEAIARSREEARRAPGDSEGNEQLFAAYQQKIAFLAETVQRGGTTPGEP